MTPQQRARALALIQSYEKHPYSPEHRVGPEPPSNLALLKLLDQVATGGLGQMLANRAHGQKPDRLAVALASLGPFREEMPLPAYKRMTLHDLPGEHASRPERRLSDRQRGDLAGLGAGLATAGTVVGAGAINHYRNLKHKRRTDIHHRD